MNCKPDLINNLIFRLAQDSDIIQINDLYEKAKTQKFCVWDENYPTINNIIYDLKYKNLYVIQYKSTIIGALSVVYDFELNNYDCWREKEKVVEIARVVVDEKFQGHNISYIMIKNLIGILKQKQIRSIHLACYVDNIPAVNIYKKIGFSFLKEEYLFDNYNYLCELII